MTGRQWAFHVLEHAYPHEQRHPGAAYQIRRQCVLCLADPRPS